MDVGHRYYPTWLSLNSRKVVIRVKSLPNPPVTPPALPVTPPAFPVAPSAVPVAPAPPMVPVAIGSTIAEDLELRDRLYAGDRASGSPNYNKIQPRTYLLCAPHLPPFVCGQSDGLPTESILLDRLLKAGLGKAFQFVYVQFGNLVEDYT